MHQHTKTSSPHTSASFYEEQEIVDQYLLFHYGTAEEILPYPFGPQEALFFPVHSLTEIIDLSHISPHARALDVGCAVGRTSFELSRYCREVIGIDYSQSFIEAANHLKKHRQLAYRRRDEGSLSTELTACVPANAHPKKITFEQGDAMNLRHDLGTFDVLHAANLLCRLTDPQKFLTRLPQLLHRGGQLVFTTPCTWLTQFTPQENWLGGYEENGTKISTLEGLNTHLHNHFTLEKTVDIPFLIREHSRKYQWSIALGSLWIRK